MSLKKWFGYTRLAIIGFGTSVLFLQPIAVAESAKLSAEQVLEQIFRSDTPMTGSTEAGHQKLLKLRSRVLEWMGPYQGVRAENGRSILLFERGSIPVRVIFKENGEPRGINASECPTTSVPISQAPIEYQKALSDCPNLTP